MFHKRTLLAFFLLVALPLALFGSVLAQDDMEMDPPPDLKAGNRFWKKQVGKLSTGTCGVALMQSMTS